MSELQPGDTLGPYRLEELLGEGGMGIVFRARRDGGDRDVALKVLRKELTGDLTFRHRFEQEARAAKEVEHRHLLPIFEASEADGRHFIAVAYVAGGSLADRVERVGPFEPATVARIVGEIAAGLDALHAHGVVHRDVKPSNVLFDRDDAAVLTDFGFAKGRLYTALTQPGQVVGTLDYLAPELIRGEPASPATDVYALGCVAYECTTGRTPFAGRTIFELDLDAPPPDPSSVRPGLSPDFAAALVSALEQEPARRPAGACAYAELLRVAAG